MRGDSDFMKGFDVGDGALLRPAIEIEPATRATLIKVMAAVSRGATPEEVTGYLEDGFPVEVAEQLDEPLEIEELSAHVDVFLSAMQTAVVKATA